MLHNDLRPDNMLVDRDGTAYLLDWNWVCLGSAWVDFLGLLPQANRQGVDVRRWIQGPPFVGAGLGRLGLHPRNPSAPDSLTPPTTLSRPPATPCRPPLASTESPMRDLQDQGGAGLTSQNPHEGPIPMVRVCTSCPGAMPPRAAMTADKHCRSLRVATTSGPGCSHSHGTATGARIITSRARRT